MKPHFYQIVVISVFFLFTTWSVAPLTIAQALENRQLSTQSASLAIIPNSRGVLADTLYVLPAGDGDCSAWVEACDLQTALALAATGDEIWVAQGLYKPTSAPTDRLATFSLPSGVVVYGGYAGTETSREQRDWVNNFTVHSGDIDNNDLTDLNGVITDTQNITGTNTYHVVSAIVVTNTVVLDGFTITGGCANGQAYPDIAGGGVLNDGTLSSNSLLMIVNTSFIGNEANAGGGAANRYGLLTVSNSIFTGNHASGGGGGMGNAYGQVIISDSTISGNLADSAGGGINNSIYGSITISNSHFTNNQAGEMGGAISNAGYTGGDIHGSTFSGNRALLGGGMYSSNPASFDLEDVIFTGNIAANDNFDPGGCYGAGIYSDGTSLNLTNVDFITNTLYTYSGTCYGGGMYNQSNKPILNQVKFQGNGAGFSFTSTYKGGGIYNQDSDPYLKDVLFDGNFANGGAGMYNNSSAPTLIDVTFENNENASRFGAGAALDNISSHPELINVAFILNHSAAEMSAVGGIYNSQSNPTLYNVVFDRNTASSRSGPAGGMYNYESNPSMVNVTFSGNQVLGAETPAAGGIYNSTGSRPELSNSILWGGVPTDTSLIVVDETSTITISHSLVAGGCPVGASCDANLLDEDPQFVDAAAGDLRLQSTSPAIDVGDNSLLPTDSFDLDGDEDISEPLPYDILRMPRISNELVDMGAFEYNIIPYDVNKVFIPLIKQP